jgi:putative heme iron utilization protein
MTDYESRLDQELLSILQTQRVAALATLQADGTPYVSMTPYAIDRSTGRVVLQVSALAPHAQHMRDDPRVSLLMIAPEVTDAGTAPPRITLEGRAEFLVHGSKAWQSCRAAFVERFPDSGPISALLDFDFVALSLRAVRQTSGFGTSRSVEGEAIDLTTPTVAGAPCPPRGPAGSGQAEPAPPSLGFPGRA